MSEQNLSQDITLEYSLNAPEELYSVGFSVYYNQDRLLKKGDKVMPFPTVLKKAVTNGAVMIGMAIAYTLLMMFTAFDIISAVIVFLVVFYAVVILRSWKENRRIYEYLLEKYLYSNGQAAAKCTLHFDESGLTNTTATGNKTFFSWSDYRYCFFVGQVIVFIFVKEKDEFIVMDRTVTAEETVRRALEEQELTHTIREVEMAKERGKK